MSRKSPLQLFLSRAGCKQNNCFLQDELSQLLGKVKDLIAENEALHEQHKTGVIKSVFEGVGSASAAATVASAPFGEVEVIKSDCFTNGT